MVDNRGAKAAMDNKTSDFLQDKGGQGEVFIAALTIGVNLGILADTAGR